jgi:hypothetical protein
VVALAHHGVWSPPRSTLHSFVGAQRRSLCFAPATPTTFLLRWSWRSTATGPRAQPRAPHTAFGSLPGGRAHRPRGDHPKSAFRAAAPMFEAASILPAPRYGDLRSTFSENEDKRADRDEAPAVMNERLDPLR